MIIWWKIKNRIWSSQQLRETGLIDYILKRPKCRVGQLRLWIGKP